MSFSECFGHLVGIIQIRQRRIRVGGAYIDDGIDQRGKLMFAWGLWRKGKSIVD